jgi:hypothetical protein
MSMIENRLRDALHDVAGDVPADAVPPLRLPPSRRRSGAGHVTTPRGLLSARWLAPLAAAASVLAIAAGITALADLSHRLPNPLTGATPAPGTVPPYYIALTGTASPQTGHRYVAGIYQTSTGRLAAQVAVPRPYRTFVDVSAAASDLTFAVAAQNFTARRPSAVAFYLVRFDPASGSTSVSALAMPPVPAGASFDAFALSPDAARLAVAFEPDRSAPGLSCEIRILNIAAGTVRTWTSTQGSVAAPSVTPSSLSWADDNATLAFNWYGSRPSGRALLATTGVRLLDTRKPGSDLVAASRLAVRLYHLSGHPDPTGLVPDVAMLTPDGRTVVAAVVSRSGTAGGFAEFSAATGRLLRKLDWRPLDGGAPSGPMDVLWASRSGRTLVVSAPPGYPRRIAIIRGSRMRLLPSPARIPFPAAAW